MSRSRRSIERLVDDMLWLRDRAKDEGLAVIVGLHGLAVDEVRMFGGAQAGAAPSGGTAYIVGSFKGVTLFSEHVDPTLVAPELAVRAQEAFDRLRRSTSEERSVECPDCEGRGEIVRRYQYAASPTAVEPSEREYREDCARCDGEGRYKARVCLVCHKELDDCECDEDELDAWMYPETKGCD